MLLFFFSEPWFLLTCSLPLFSLSISLFSLGEAGNNSIFNYSIQRSAKVNAHWRTALEQRAEESWRRVVSAAHSRREDTYTGKHEGCGPATLHLAWQEDSAVSSRLKNNCRILLLPSFCCQQHLHSQQLCLHCIFCAKTYIENFPATVLICGWSLDGKGEQFQLKQDELHYRFLQRLETCNVIVQLYA